MKKLIGILIVIAAICIISVFVLSLFAGKIIQKGVVTLGPEVAQVEIELDKANISFLSGSGGLEGLKVHNPEGYSGEHAFFADHISLDLQPMSVMGDKIVIDEILIIGPDIQFEKKQNTSNLNQILENVQSFLGPAQESDEPAKGKKLEIKRFVLQDAKVGVGLGANPITITIPTIELTNLGGGEAGITAGEVISVMLTKVTSQILNELAKNPDVLLQGIGDSGGDTLKSIKSGLGGLLGGSKEKDTENN